MRHFSKLAWAGVIVGILVGKPAVAEKNAKLPLKLGKVGSETFRDHFEIPKLGESWSVAKGSWQVESQMLVAKEVPADKHAGVVSIGKLNRDSVVRFSFQLNGAKQLALSMNKAKGHLFRVVFNEAGITLLKDKDKSQADSKSVVLAQAKSKFEPGTWYSVQLEICGDQVAVQTDNGLSVTAQDKQLDVEKTGYRFVVSGASIALDDVQIAGLSN